MLVAFGLAACHRHDELTASEAIQAADAELAKALPRMEHHMLDVEATMDIPHDRWLVEYRSGTGGWTVHVDMRSGKAIIDGVQQ